MANKCQKEKPRQEDFSLKETNPNISARRATTLDLVEKMQFLFVRVVKAKDLSSNSDDCCCVVPCCNPFVEVRIGALVGTTRSLEKTVNPEWNQDFAFAKDKIQASVLEILVQDKCVEDNKDVFIGKLVFLVNDVPMRVSPNSPLAPEWYKLEDHNGVKLTQGELMVSVWMGNQADEAFPHAWHSDSATGTDHATNTRSNVYHSPRFWYLRVYVIQAQNLLLKGKSGGGNLELFVKAVLGNLASRSRPVKICQNPVWNEDLMFVVAEPFDELLILSIEVGDHHKHENIGRCVLPLKNVERRMDDTLVESVWCNLENPNSDEGRLHVRASLDGGYHVLDEVTHYSSDFRPSSRSLSQPSVGVLELGILNAVGLSPMKKENRVDTYCVAKYGPKWVRTRTIVDNRCPKWNEQYTWEVFDPCTVITVMVFDNGQLQEGKPAEDKRMGKVRIRLSTLETGRIYTHSYPLISLSNQGVKKMGEIQLAVRFSCSSLLNVLQTYAQPLLPRMHYICPLSIFQLDSLRNQAAAITTLRFMRKEPPLGKEVVEYMLDVRENVWSMRRGRAQFHRIVDLLSVLVFICKWVKLVYSWKSSATTIAGYIFFLWVIFCPQMILVTIFTSLFLLGIWRYITRPRHPSHMDIQFSYAHTVTNEELEEEFDTFPTRFSGNDLKKKYDRLRGISGRVLAVISDLTTQGERVQSLLTWRDPRATSLFVVFCFFAAIVTYTVPFRFMISGLVAYSLRPPRVRGIAGIPAIPQNFLRRMPARSDGML
ncbi:hypothetical protein PIB30_068297 [Stylosanthes scabra]|uniref:C2 domain-containing protein n=1 Tax=Stylosanthes scabra TaxID=79078 RepID=A0ABU6VLB6_9FABA|nr:hypothetical protein [Stylosanthes scabra]